MNSSLEDILAALGSLPSKSVNGASCVSIADIARACLASNARDFRTIEAKLKSLEIMGEVTLIRQSPSGIIVGAILN